MIELITVVAIIGILSAVAIQAVGRYRAQAYDARAMHDLANAVKAEEAYYATFNRYVTFSATGPQMVPIEGLAVVVSDSVTLEMEEAEDQLSFFGSAISSLGTGNTFRYDSVTDTFISD